jgi:dynein heavy chain, axonemal
MLLLVLLLWQQVNLINFTVTRAGLEEQLLGETVKLERPDIEARHRGLITAIAAGKLQL